MKILSATFLAAVFAISTAAAQDAPRLTEVEQLRLELSRTKVQLGQLLVQVDQCRAVIGTRHDLIAKLRAENIRLVQAADEAALQAQFEAAHPGYAADVKTGTLIKKGGQ